MSVWSDEHMTTNDQIDNNKQFDGIEHNPVSTELLENNDILEKLIHDVIKNEISNLINGILKRDTHKKKHSLAKLNEKLNWFNSGLQGVWGMPGGRK